MPVLPVTGEKSLSALLAMKVEKQRVDHGKVSRGRIGVMIQEVNQDLATSFGLEKPLGALVSSVKGQPGRARRH